MHNQLAVDPSISSGRVSSDILLACHYYYLNVKTDLQIISNLPLAQVRVIIYV